MEWELIDQGQGGSFFSPVRGTELRLGIPLGEGRNNPYPKQTRQKAHIRSMVRGTVIQTDRARGL